MTNLNKIVRIHNKQVSAQIERVSRETGMSFQYVFNRACELWVEGYVFGFDFHLTLFAYVVKILDEQKES